MKAGKPAHAKSELPTVPTGNFISAYRKKAIELIEKTHWEQWKNDSNLKKGLIELFNDYVECISNKIIILQNIENGEYEYIPYKTRWTDKDRWLENLRKYDRVWKNATKRYKVAVFLTLTTDPNRFNSIMEMAESINIAWDKFRAWVRKRFGKKIEFIRILEFTKSGIPHLHIVLFGIEWLADKHEITEEWNRTGQGIITYVYKLMNKGGRWVWVKKPKELRKNQQIRNYLKKYLRKAQSRNNELAVLYWATNKRFWGYSRSLLKNTNEYIPSGIYIFVMSCFWWEVPDWLLDITDTTLSDWIPDG